MQPGLTHFQQATAWVATVTLEGGTAMAVHSFRQCIRRLGQVLAVTAGLQVPTSVQADLYRDREPTLSVVGTELPVSIIQDKQVYG